LFDYNLRKWIHLKLLPTNLKICLQFGTILKNITATLKKEISLFDAGGNRGLHLELAYKLLRYIPPTSVESERAFSSAGYFCSKLRSRFNDDSLDKLCFLRFYSQKNC